LIDALGVVGIASIALVGAAAVRSVSRTTDVLVGMFQSRHDLGWPVGVQEEDLPPRFAAATSEARPDSEPDGAVGIASSRPRRRESGVLSPLRPAVRAGSARR
jgi:hypothetical protein